MTCHSLFKLKIDQLTRNKDFVCNVGYGTQRAKEILQAGLIIIDKISMFTIIPANQIDYTLRSLVFFQLTENNKNQNFDFNSITAFGGKLILFVGDLLQLPPVIKNSNASVSSKLITCCPFWKNVKIFGLKDPVRCINKMWNDFLVEIGNGKTGKYYKWHDLQKDCNITVTRDFEVARDFFIQNVNLSEKYQLDRQWICTTNTYVDVFLESEMSKEINMTEALDFVNKISLKDIPPSKIDLLVGEPMCLMRNVNTAEGMAKNQRCYVVNRTTNSVVIEFEDKIEKIYQGFILKVKPMD